MKSGFMKMMASGLLCAAVLFAPAIFAQEAKSGQEQKASVVAFIDVNVAPMDRERIIENQTVIICDGRIAEIGPAAKIKVPDGAQRIDAQGKYLANEVGIRFGGHVPNDVGIERALKAGQSSIEHIDGYLEAVDLDKIDDARIKQLATMTREAGAWVTPTMALWQTTYGRETAEALRRQRPETQYMPPQAINQWTQQRDAQLTNIPADTGRRVIEFRDRMLKALSDAGAKILLGSDAPQLFSVPGFSLRREMETM